MESNYQPQTDLASILQTLRAYAPSQQQAPEATYQSQALRAHHQPQAPPQTPDLEEDEYDPSTYDPSLPLITVPHPQAAPAQAPDAQPQQSPPTPETRHRLEKTTPSYPRPPPEPTPAAKPPASTPGPKKAHAPPGHRPATITTWAPALRHVTGQTTADPEFGHRVRHLITTQRDHERQWWDGREDLKKRLAGREEGRKKLDSVLGSLGGHVNASKTDEFSEEEELKMYDRKVYQACREMVAATVKELKKLEVPFFCTVEGLVSPKGDGKAQGKRKGTVSEAELAELRGRMMVLLEDLCGEEE
ncbi:hypothetical protein HO133_001930 [Letharia lupina]|uniref:Uncharacterized protein n=1 Tax=Letharia lupina TaxID=560253 RepID=A0A8H6FB49_9LECA|nr:uncharacterized protein HO133_001930 [Letharia lupina]KAF6221962.1 hypothetical protein HO133_001930 [Letharia lupina]